MEKLWEWGYFGKFAGSYLKAYYEVLRRHLLSFDTHTSGWRETSMKTPKRVGEDFTMRSFDTRRYENLNKLFETYYEVLTLMGVDRRDEI